MSSEVKVRNIVIGTGMPKICIPVMGTTMQEIETAVKGLTGAPFDLVEWRADYFKAVADPAQVVAVLEMLRGHLADVPLLFTLRTREEGGEQQLSFEEYIMINIGVIDSGLVDMIDVQTSAGDDIAFVIIEAAHEAGVKVMASQHYFTITPKKEELIMRLCKMQDLEADVVKVAVMPQCERDVLTLLDASLVMKELHRETPVVAIAMGELGAVSRIAGRVFGSAITFGTVGAESAPGQLPAAKLKEILASI